MLRDFVGSVEIGFDEGAAGAELLGEGFVRWIGEAAWGTGGGGEEYYGAGRSSGSEEGGEVGEAGYVLYFSLRFCYSVGG